MMLPTIAASQKAIKSRKLITVWSHMEKLFTLLSIHHVLPFHTYGTLEASVPHFTCDNFISLINTDKFSVLRYSFTSNVTAKSTKSPT